jgi:hypothetical protein
MISLFHGFIVATGTGNLRQQLPASGGDEVYILYF